MGSVRARLAVFMGILPVITLMGFVVAATF
jgi:hypothetical protein